MNRQIIQSKGITIALGVFLTLAVTCVDAFTASVRGTVRFCAPGREAGVSATQVVFWDKFAEPSVENVRFTDTNGAYRFDDLAVGRLYYLAIFNRQYSAVPLQEVAVESDVSKDLGRTCLSNPRSFVQLPLPTFEKDSSVISQAAGERFHRLFSMSMRRDEPPGFYILVSGYSSADEKHDTAFARAKALRDFFVALKIPETDIELQSFGASCPDELNDLAKNRRATFDIIREGTSTLDIIGMVSCAAGSAPRIFKPDGVRVTKVEESERGLAVTLTYNYVARKGDGGAYILVHAMAEGDTTPVASRSSLLTIGERSITLNLTKLSGTTPKISTQLEIIMLHKKVVFHQERFAYTKRWR